MTNPHHHPALFLPLALLGVDRLANVGNREVAVQPPLAGAFVHFHFGCRQADLPERCHTAQGCTTFPTIAAAANELSAREAEVVSNNLGIGQATAGPLDATVTQSQMR